MFESSTFSATKRPVAFEAFSQYRGLYVIFVVGAFDRAKISYFTLRLGASIERQGLDARGPIGPFVIS